MAKRERVSERGRKGRRGERNREVELQKEWERRITDGHTTCLRSNPNHVMNTEYRHTLPSARLL